MQHSMKLTGLAASIAMLVGSMGTAFAGSSLTLFHNNDGESKLLGSGGFGGFDYFLGELNAARNAASTAGRDVLTVSSGDNFLAGLAWNASANRRGSIGFLPGNSNNYYDAMALSAVGYDAITLGNHDFDFGPDVLADFMLGYRAAGGTGTFLSSNLDFSGESNLKTLADFSYIAKSTVVEKNGNRYGIIGATTERLSSISSPRNINVSDVATAVNAEVASLQAAGVNKIILSTHLQGIENEQDLVPQLSGVDVIIAGGGDELLTNQPDANTEARFGPAIEGPYPTVSSATDMGGNNIAIVTTTGEYRYIGNLNVEFDDDGNVIDVGPNNPILVDPATSTYQATGVVNGIDIQNDIMQPLAADVAALEATVVGTTEVALDGRRSSVRTMETNLGNLITDAFVWQAQQIGGLTGAPVVGMTNGGGIRNDSVIDPGDLTVADVIGILPFANSVVTLNGVTVDDLVATLEHSIAELPDDDGRFLQVSGISFDYDPATLAVKAVRLADGTLLYTEAAGDVFGNTLDIVSNSFTAAGGDDHATLASYLATDLSVQYGDALAAYIAASVDDGGLGGVIPALDYAAGGEGRISAVPLPAAAWLFLGALGLLGASVRKRV